MSPATHTPGISALQLQRQLGITSNDTTWYMLQRLRKGMVNDGRTLLNGLIEADETIIGSPAKGQRGRGSVRAAHKALVIGAVEVLQYTDQGKPKERAGRVRLQMIAHATSCPCPGNSRKSAPTCTAHSSSLQQSQDLAQRYPPWGGTKISPGVPRRIRVSFQP